jgi:hypothetical protein
MEMPPRVLVALLPLRPFAPLVPPLHAHQHSTHIERCNSQIRAADRHSLVQRPRVSLTHFT